MSKYAEVRCDYYNEEGGVWCIDAWLTDDDNEEGRIIAEIDDDGNVIYSDSDARYDEYAQEVINKTIEKYLLND